MNGWLSIQAVMAACETANRASPAKAEVILNSHGIKIVATWGDPRRVRRLEFSRLLSYHELARIPHPAQILDCEIRNARVAVERAALDNLEASNAG